MGCRVSVQVDAKATSPNKTANKKQNKSTNVTLDPRNNEMLSSPDPSSDFDYTITSPDGILIDKKGIQVN